MLFNVKATIRKVDRGIENDTESQLEVIHPVDADTADHACDILNRFYAKKSDFDQPYGVRYTVQDCEAFELLSEPGLLDE